MEGIHSAFYLFMREEISYVNFVSILAGMLFITRVFPQHNSSRRGIRWSKFTIVCSYLQIFCILSYMKTLCFLILHWSRFRCLDGINVLLGKNQELTSEILEPVLKRIQISWPLTCPEVTQTHLDEQIKWFWILEGRFCGAKRVSRESGNYFC